MTREDIIRLAREAGFSAKHTDVYFDRQLERFTTLVAAAEREACARMFDGPVWSYDYREIAAAIRTRGVK